MNGLRVLEIEEGFAVLNADGVEVARHKVLSLATLKPIAATWGLVITRCDQEFRINKRGGREATAAYTDDPLDAINTGIAMAEKGVW